MGSVLPLIPKDQQIVVAFFHLGGEVVSPKPSQACDLELAIPGSYRANEKPITIKAFEPPLPLILRHLSGICLFSGFQYFKADWMGAPLWHAGCPNSRLSGIKGTFTITCEHVTRVLGSNKESLMAMLEAFVYDPLINWRLLSSTVSPKDK